MCAANNSNNDQRPPTGRWATASRVAVTVAGVVAGVAGGVVVASGDLAGAGEPGSSVVNAGLVVVPPASATAKFSKKSVMEKLSQVPVFAVTNASGQPYLANVDGSGNQVGLLFCDHVSALEMLKQLQASPGASDARVYAMDMGKSYEMARAQPTPSGIRGPNGEELSMTFKFFPDPRQVKVAEKLLGKKRLRNQAVEGIPCFIARGLSLRKGSENLQPLFLAKDDLDAAWAKLRETNKDLPEKATVEVGNLLYIIQQMEKGEHPELANLGFFPPRASVEYVTQLQGGPTNHARLHHNPVAK
jgi:hypothetical protein